MCAMSANMRRAHTPGNLADAFEIDNARISRRPTHQKLGLVLFSYALKFIIVNRFGFARDAIVRDFVTQARKV